MAANNGILEKLTKYETDLLIKLKDEYKEEFRLDVDFINYIIDNYSKELNSLPTPKAEQTFEGLNSDTGKVSYTKTAFTDNEKETVKKRKKLKYRIRILKRIKTQIEFEHKKNELIKPIYKGFMRDFCKDIIEPIMKNENCSVPKAVEIALERYNVNEIEQLKGLNHEKQIRKLTDSYYKKDKF